MMSLSLCGEPSTFMRLMREVKNSLTNVFAYLDDAIIYSESEEDHQERLHIFSNASMITGCLLIQTNVFSLEKN